MSAFARMHRFYEAHLSIGDRLGESIYAVWMVVVSVGLINSELDITPEYVAVVVAIAFGVNLAWGLIDGITVMLTNVIDRARRDELVHDIRARKDDPAVRARAAAHFEGTVLAVLDDGGRAAVIDLIAAGPGGPDPRERKARATRSDWSYALAIVLIDVLLVVPIAAPLLILSDVDTAIFVSRLIATTIFAALGAAYARNLRRRPWVAAVFLGTLGYAVFTLAFETGW